LYENWKIRIFSWCLWASTNAYFFSIWIEKLLPNNKNITMKVFSILPLFVAFASAQDEVVARDLQTVSVTDYTATCYGGRYVVSHVQYNTSA